MTMLSAWGVKGGTLNPWKLSLVDINYSQSCFQSQTVIDSDQLHQLSSQLIQIRLLLSEWPGSYIRWDHGISVAASSPGVSPLLHQGLTLPWSIHSDAALYTGLSGVEGVPPHTTLTSPRLRPMLTSPRRRLTMTFRKSLGEFSSLMV